MATDDLIKGLREYVEARDEWMAIDAFAADWHEKEEERYDKALDWMASHAVAVADELEKDKTCQDCVRMRSLLIEARGHLVDAADYFASCGKSFSKSVGWFRDLASRIKETTDETRCGKEVRDKTIAARCTNCLAEFTQKEIDENVTGACLKCGSSSVPCDPKKDVQLPINWHELRILSNWAAFWCEENINKMTGHSVAAFYSILRRLDRYRPEGAAGLTLYQEIEEINKDKTIDSE